jgi:hypothetical protein
MNMNRWLYRAAGTVGIAGGFLLLGAGSAHADQASDTDPESMEALLGDVFSPTSGLPPLDLTGGDQATGSLASSALTLDPADGRHGTADRPAAGEPELLPGLPGLSGLPTGGLDSLLGGLPLGSVPMDSLGLPGGAVGAGGPLVSGDDDLLSVDGDAVGLPTRLTDPGARTLPAPAEAAPATDPAPEIVGSMPFLTQPLTNAVLGGGSLGDLVTLGDLAGQVPVAGPMVSQTVGGAPLVSDVVAHQPQHAAPPAQLQPADPAAGPVGLPVDTTDPLGLAQPVTGDQLPAVIGQELATEAGFSPELLGGGLPFIGNGLDPLSRMVGVGNLPSQLPMVGPLTGSVLGDLPVAGDPAPADPAGPAADPAAGLPDPAAPDPAAPGPAALGPGATAERPVGGEDPEYAESAYSAPAELLPAAPGLGALPVAGLTQQLPVPSLDVLRSLPVIGEVAGGLPL